MATDIFGDLREWDRVLGLLEQLRERRLLDEHQQGLARIVRTGDNWRLRRWVLEHAVEVHQAGSVLVDALLGVLQNEEAALSDRVLAARGLGHLLLHRVPENTPGPQRPTAETLQDLLTRPAAPVLHDALDDSLTPPTKTR